MSETISDASHSASGATDCRLMVQLALLERGILTMSNSTLRHSGCRSSARAPRHRISSSVAEVFAKPVSVSMSHPLPGGRRGGTARDLGMIFGAAVVNAPLRAKAWLGRAWLGLAWQGMRRTASGTGATTTLAAPNPATDRAGRAIDPDGTVLPALEDRVARLRAVRRNRSQAGSAGSAAPPARLLRVRYRSS